MNWNKAKQKTKRILSHPLSYLILIVLLAAGLRLFALGKVPAGLTWDEAAIGYNGQAVLTTRRDEWLNFLPISFRSFGDFKAPLAIYLNGLFTEIFGLTPFGVRLPFALSGIVAVIGFYFLTNQIFKHLEFELKILSARQVGLTGALILALSPWHLQLTRAGFESGMSLSLIIWGLSLVLLYLESQKLYLESQKPEQDKQSNQKNKSRWLALFAGSSLLVASIYTYHSAKIFTPLLLIIVIAKSRAKLIKNWKLSLAVFVWTVLLLVPFLIDSFLGQGLTRGGTLIFSQRLGLGGTLAVFVNNLLIHLKPSFLILGLTDTLRHSPGRWAVLLPTTFVLLILGLLVFLRKQKSNFSFVAAWILLGLTPAALGQIAPQANRALLALPGLIWLALVGLDWLLAQGKRFDQLISPTRLALIVLVTHLCFFLMYLNYYYREFSRRSAEAFNQGYLETMEIVKQYETGSGGKPEVGQIVFSSQYGQPYIYALFSRKTNPIWYHGGSLSKYLFPDQVTPGDVNLRQNTLVVATARDDLPAQEADHLVRDTAGNVRFKLYYVP
ncbi:MAG: hypothetical protein GF381_00830 [Candidatus Pacebacteria bacterium]|nr:hypothetical protein [Candidatus Paceibacterota bacterium]